MEVAKRAILFLAFATIVLGFYEPETPRNCPTNPKVGCPIGHYKSWDYIRKTDWGNMCPHYSQCKSGVHQSPINIPALPNNATLPTTLQFSLNNTRVRLIRVGNYLNLPVNTNNTMFWNNKLWYLQRVEFHSPSEHTFQGQHAPLEVQLYFQSHDTFPFHEAAVSIHYDVGCCDDPFLSRVVPSLPKRFACECGNNRTEFWEPFKEECDQGPNNALLPDHCRPNCVLPYCGDGVHDSGEQCDHGNSSNVPNRCRTDCTLPYCGDHIVDNLFPYLEQCDDGNNVSGDGCSSTCKVECGDWVLQSDVEECDMGTYNTDQPTSDPNACRKNCLRKRCGDGIVDPGEECDEGFYGADNSTGGSLNPNHCRPNCKKPSCGDRVVDPLYGEACEPNRDLYPANNDPCTTTCKLYCGDGVVDTARGEQCDNGVHNSNTSSSCRLNCKNPFCGDGIVDQGEQCDDGANTPRCNLATCTFRCGNGIVESGELCDDADPSLNPNNGNSNTRPDACRLNCQPARCGDGILDGGEQCDQGVNNSDTTPNACRTNCKLPYCGDHVVDSNEQCDYGYNKTHVYNGTANGVFNGTILSCDCCRLTCGDGVRQPFEDCDDGSSNSNTLPDRCRNNCIRHFCGDGVTDSEEECDYKSGNSPYCSTNCTLPFCGNGVVESGLGEECDNGEQNSYSTINGCSPICTLNRCGQTLTNIDVNLRELIPSQVEQAYSYPGSSTHPPCHGGVEWFVLPNLRHMSATQYYAFTNLISKNNRHVHHLNGRNPLFRSSQYHHNDPRFGAVCGNGHVEHGEQCDHGEWNNDRVPNACRTSCKFSHCGDEVHDEGEECDGEPWCTFTCKRHQRHYEPSSYKGCSNVRNQGIWDHFSKNNTCYGNRQSPIRLPEVCTTNRPYNLSHPTHVQYNPTPITLFNTGSDILFPVISGGTFNFKGHTYVLTHIEFHEPSEHHIGNRQFPFEVQLVHTAQNYGEKKIVVLSVLFEEVKEKNAFLQPILDRLPLTSNCKCGNGIKEAAMSHGDGRISSEQCDLGRNNSDTRPNGCRHNCVLHHCGDGVIDSGEICDDGHWNSYLPNRCRPNCRQPYCGDGVIDDELYEECDDGNNVNNDGCSSSCQRECGDGFKSPNEECDHGEFNSDTKSNGCRTDCRKCYCGDNVVDPSEQCDDGLLNSDSTPNTCRTNCRLPICGDGVVDEGEECDGTPGCFVNCTLLCGNGVIDPSEECDDGKKNSDLIPNACRTNCKFSYCGDNVRDVNEECDTGDADTPYCQNCQIRCGNGILETGEECDNGCSNSDEIPDACRSNCYRAHCGDGVLDIGEQCDQGTFNGNVSGSCRLNCKLPFCGDRIVDHNMGEQCDGGLGCDSSCKKLCGNGRIDPGELCDDGFRNADTIIGCSELTVYQLVVVMVLLISMKNVMMVI